MNFTVNDEDFHQVVYPLLREDVRTVFWYYPGSEKSGFSCKANLTKKEALAHGSVVFKYINRKTRQPINNNHNYYYYEDNLVLPDAIRRKRVHGNDNEIMFRFIGYTIYTNLELILKKLFNKNYNDFSNILDWGCDAGELLDILKIVKTHQLPVLISIQIISIDAINI